MNLYTRTGDKGDTSLIGGRVRKDDIRVEAYGTLDELNAFVGQTAAEAEKHEVLQELVEELIVIQHELFDCGADLAYARPGAPLKVNAEPAARLETQIDRYSAEAPELTRFILPGGSSAAALLHVCRTVCRRAERLVVTLASEHPANPEVQIYLNRLSDYFFAASRVANARLGVSDVEYVRSAEVFRKRDPK
ncbi:cob(I)yrinic acid a,c-diamide adenosyltransferase [Paenibacillus radicis (ex Gao et al. 2016)]|uniref:Corrinoid adenosyltransferase n=1 Tax=Paenibacillus radicis (ex Gao et al. 2016) TaxID=1737354 RepID=A0A917GLQ6_9BACL|nr:cob(I)yrinic acid a,c-diamide adenosyltransferase [Paenibacillus radicis (ex Gao et al. 2016)]GGG51415.1 Cob(I)yrinic acid a,c-diamide adenosyltransferase [Paenibacillus radicis (ex Gao et al. 2016)]